MKKTDIQSTIIIIVLCGCTIAIYRYINPDKDIERFYYHHNKVYYYLLYLAYAILIMSLSFNIKFLASSLWTYAKKYF